MVRDYNSWGSFFAHLVLFLVALVSAALAVIECILAKGTLSPDQTLWVGGCCAVTLSIAVYLIITGATAPKK